MAGIQQAALSLAVQTMDKHFSKHCMEFLRYSDEGEFKRLGYGDAINILDNMRDPSSIWIKFDAESMPTRHMSCLVIVSDGHKEDIRQDVWEESDGVWDWNSRFEGVYLPYTLYYFEIPKRPVETSEILKEES